MDSGNSWSGRERNCAYLNLGDGRFADVSAISGLDFLDDGRAAALSDWDGDGDLDLFLKNRTGPLLRFMRNDEDGGQRFLSLRLIGQRCNRDAVGAMVEVFAGGRCLVHQLAAGEGYLAQSSKTLHFGLGRAEKIERVRVCWPGGEAEEFQGLEPNRSYELTQGVPEARLVPARSAVLPVAPNTAPPSPGSARVVLRTPLPLPRVIGGRAAPALINLWSRTCAPCVEELGELAARDQDLRAAGLACVPLCLDGSAEWPEVQALFASRIAAGRGDLSFAPRLPQAGEIEFLRVVLEHVLARPADVVPASFLVDCDLRLQIVYLGPVAPDQLLADAERYGKNPPPGAERGAFPGRWFSGMPRDLRGLAAACQERGLQAEARFYEALAAGGGALPPRRE
ncbi:MAG: ASPIC/UnbV domain-containing protein [Planctomycetes bacterium]|nr:ASPIC/UnbV domain-containing protein [Planctomycetota bacterium]